jgi:hypothetical protein
MDRQVADDPGYQVRDVWLGAKNARWPWDWTFPEWTVAFVVFVFGGILITWVIPSALVIALVTWRLARTLSTRINPDEPRRTFWVVVGCVVVVCAVLSLNPLTWIQPLWLPVALVVSFWLPRIAVKRYGQYLDWNRPIAYWLRMPGIVARGPRLLAEDQIDPGRLALGLDLKSLGHETGPIHKIVRAKITDAPGPHKPRLLCRIDGGLYSERFHYALIWGRK